MSVELDPEVEAVVAEMKAKALPPLDKSTPAERREIINVYYEFQAPKLEVGLVRDEQIGSASVPIRIYTPVGAGPFPALVYFHGGGWIAASVELYDQPCRWLCHHGQAVVISVDYRLAPENKFPIPLEDARTAFAWTAAHAEELNIRSSAIAVGGDSSGGNLAAALAIEQPGIALQLLIYPVLNYDFETKSYCQFENGPMLTRAGMQACWAHYLNDEDEAELPQASPLRAKNFESLPPACILTAEYDPVRDDGEDYAAHLGAAGVRVQRIRYQGTTHGLLQMTGRVALARQMLNDASEALRDLR